ncbi:MAG: type II toxin-antitoxin system VapB family antitoxin [Candidatus Alcyoniella australis]|nr:type II toxin-antitoxin system VapB family antitoxin [Candidatus Alcyoniella australis]
MRTTVTLDEGLVREVMSVTSAKTKTAAVALALREHVRRKRIEKLRSILGKVDIDAVDLENLRAEELREAEWIDE